MAVYLSGWQDSNLRPSAPKADALPDCATPRFEFGCKGNHWNWKNNGLGRFIYKDRGGIRKDVTIFSRFRHRIVTNFGFICYNQIYNPICSLFLKERAAQTQNSSSYFIDLRTYWGYHPIQIPIRHRRWFHHGKSTIGRAVCHSARSFGYRHFRGELFRAFTINFLPG